MSLTSLHQTSLTNPLIIPSNKPRNRPKIQTPCNISCKKYSLNDNDHTSRRVENELVKLAVVTLAAGVLTLQGCVGDALAAKSGGRIGGQAFRSSPPPRSSSPRANSRTNIYVNPRVAPPLVGGYGYGYGVPFYGGWGWSPFSFFAPGPSVAVGVGGGFDLIVLFMVFGAVAAVIRRFRGSRDDEDDDY